MKKFLITILCLASLLVAQENTKEKVCKTKADKNKGCVESIESDYDGSITQQWYKGGKVVQYKNIDRKGTLTRQWRIEKVGKIDIFYDEDFNSDGNKISERRCVVKNNKSGYIMGSPSCDMDKLQVRKNWNLKSGEIISNCEYRTFINYNISFMRDISLNGWCGGFGEECYKDGESYECDDIEKARLAEQDFSDFYKKCYRIFGNGEVDGPCKDNKQSKDKK